MTNNQRFAAAIGIKPNQAVYLLTLIQRSVAAYTDWDSKRGTEDAYNKALDRCDNYAKRLGLALTWPGLYPMVTTPDGQQHHLPDSSPKALTEATAETLRQVLSH